MSRAPFFASCIAAPVDGFAPVNILPGSAFAITAYQLVTDAIDLVSRGSHQTSSSYSSFHRNEIFGMESRLLQWHDALLPDWQFNMSNLTIDNGGGKVDCLSTMFALYHMANLYLARFVRYHLLPRDAADQCVRKAHLHAKRILHITSVLCSFAQTLSEQQRIHQMLSPVLGHAVVVAVDTLTTRTINSTEAESTLSSAEDGLTILNVIGHTWAGCRVQSEKVESRLHDLRVRIHQSRVNSSRARLMGQHEWRVDAPMEPIFEADYDIVLGTDSQSYWEALRDVG